MVREGRGWRKLDNTAKVFSLAEESNTSIFRFSAILKEKIDVEILTLALNKTLDDYPAYRVKLGIGFFWHYLEENLKEPIISKEKERPCEHINFRKNNNYLFKVTYYKNKINLDIFHVLTDGTGAIMFFKALIYHYLEMKYDLLSLEKEELEVYSHKDHCLKYYDKKYRNSYRTKEAYLIPGKVNRTINNTYHYMVSLKRMKRLCGKLNVTITEYLTALYIYAIYLSLYDKSSNKEISISIPINLRKHFNDETLVNFFTYMDVLSNVVGKEKVTFEDILKHIHNEFKEKLTSSKINEYLARDVNLGMNLSIRLVPLFVKKLFMRYMDSFMTKSATSRLSNIGIIDIDKRYVKYIDNILVLVIPNNVQKIKCTICSFEDKLNITMNSNINDLEFENVFLELLKNDLKRVEVISNNIKMQRKRRKGAIVCIR